MEKINGELKNEMRTREIEDKVIRRKDKIRAVDDIHINFTTIKAWKEDSDLDNYRLYFNE